MTDVNQAVLMYTYIYKCTEISDIGYYTWLVMKSIFLLFFISLFSLSAIAQKIKYKDLYILLETKDYERAEPFLRQYLVQEPEDANAQLYMGFIMEEKTSEADILKETDRLIELSDSAILYYNNATNLLNENGIKGKKEEEYFKDYARRDLRTGKYGVKVADVTFDLEKRIGALQAKSENATSIKTVFMELQDDYKICLDQYNALAADFTSFNVMVFNSDETLVGRLDELNSSYDQMTSKYETYKGLLEKVGNVGYNQELEVVEISGFIDTQDHAPDFYENKIALFNFGGWSTASQEMINKEVGIVLSGLSSYQNSLAEMKRKTLEESAVMDPTKTGISPDVLIDKLRTFEEDPFPQYLYQFQRAQISYNSVLNEMESEGFADTTNYFYKSQKLQELEIAFAAVSTSYESLKGKHERDGVDLYTKLLSEYGDFDGYLDENYKFAVAEEIKITNLREEITNRMMWAYSENDSIPLSAPATLVEAVEGTDPYITFSLDTLTETAIAVTGYHRIGSEFEGFYAIVNPELKTEKINLIDFEKPVSADSVISIECFSRMVMDSINVEFITAFINIDGVNNQYPARIVRSDSEGIKMNKSFTWDNRPRDFALNLEDGSLQVLLLEQEEESVYVSLDKEGNVVNQ